MGTEDRKDSILSLLHTHGKVQVEDLAKRFSVTSQTIRNDLRTLSDYGLVNRTHGGASRLLSVSNNEYAERRKRRCRQKESMGKCVASLIPDDCSVTLNIGTSTEQVAKALVNHREIIVLSNNINIINALIGSKTKQLILVGGMVRQSDGAIVGEDAAEYISRFKVDFAVIGASSLDEDGAVMDFDVLEVSVARAMLANARTRILVCDSSKFGRTAPVRICDVGDLDYFITDQRPPDKFSRLAEASGTEVVVAD